MIHGDRAISLANELAASALAQSPAFEAHALERLRNAVLAASRRQYTTLSRPILRALPVGAPAEATGFALRWLIADLAGSFAPERTGVALPPSIAALYPDELAALLDRTAEPAEGLAYGPESDDCLKEIALAAGRLLPMGRSYADPAGRLPRAIVTAGGPAQALRAVRLIARSGGVAPFVAMHTHRRSPGDRGGEGVTARLQRSADLLRLNPRLRGETGASWMYDPRVSAISPHLAFTRESKLDGGAQAFFLLRDHDGRSGALERSTTRKRLYDEGAYVPEVWSIVWPRRELLAWDVRVRADEARLATPQP